MNCVDFNWFFTRRFAGFQQALGSFSTRRVSPAGQAYVVAGKRRLAAGYIGFFCMGLAYIQRPNSQVDSFLFNARSTILYSIQFIDRYIELLLPLDSKPTQLCLPIWPRDPVCFNRIRLAAACKNRARSPPSSSCRCVQNQREEQSKK